MRTFCVNLVSAASIAALAFSAIPAEAQAQTTTVRSGNFAGAGANIPRQYGGGFYSYFSTGMRHNGSTLFTDAAYFRNATSTNRGRMRMRWNGNSSGDDYVTGLGWNSSSRNRTRTISFNSHTYSPRDTSVNDSSSTPRVSTMGPYGWLCPTRSGQQMVEYYVVESWRGSERRINGVNRFVPFATTRAGSGTISGRTYDFFYSGRITRGNGCGPGNATFRQLWAVRRGKDSTGFRSINMDNFFDYWERRRDSIGNVSAPPGYQIVAVEGIGATRGTFDVTVRN